MPAEDIETKEVIEPQAVETDNLQTDTGDVSSGEAVIEEAPAASEPEQKKDGVQERFGELTRKAREAQEEAAYWRGKAEGMTSHVPVGTPAPQEPPPPAITPDMFDTDAEYQAALTKHITDSVMKTVSQRNQAQTEQQKIAKRNEQVFAAQKDLPDILEVGSGQRFMTKEMLEAADGDDFPKIFHYLGKNRTEANRIASLSPSQQAKEIGKIEVKVTTNKSPPKKTTSAPDPPKGIGPGVGNPVSKDPNKMSYAEKKAAWEKKRLDDLGVPAQ